MLAFSLILALVGWLLIWSAITGANPLDEIRAAFGSGAAGALAPKNRNAP